MTVPRVLVAVGVAGLLAAAATFRPPRAAPAFAPALVQPAEPGVRARATPRTQRHGRHPRQRHRRPPPPRLDLNAAGAAALARIPGLSDQLAARIVAFRALNGRFESLDELTDVDGISSRRLDAVSRYLFVR
ncbi:MAG: helix-hairpin-helix domain-containing protein [Candidatus Eremiobacteraeota bacterium]|nr:helix-hairpin-helix domain-containing protein [Candidatus Eremiobacteraeota bacterium]